MIEAGAVPVFIQLLLSPHEDVQEQVRLLSIYMNVVKIGEITKYISECCEER